LAAHEQGSQRTPLGGGRTGFYVSSPQPELKTMTIQVGDRLPQATFMTPTPEGPAPISTDEVFKGKRVALFAVPGAFTPTCSAKHLPGFKEQAEAIKAKGVDLIACVSVNDVFVMKAWAKDQGVGEEIMMLADGNGEFTKALGLELNASKFGMGSRSQRYSLIANDGVVEQLNVESAGEFRVSSADYLLEHL
jgi:glutaredoxin/glutathione-dependent peroxiredoxin